MGEGPGKMTILFLSIALASILGLTLAPLTSAMLELGPFQKVGLFAAVTVVILMIAFIEDRVRR